MYFEKCYIEGGVDFIFGGATAYFEDCEFKSVEPGYVFAPNTPEHVKTGFVAKNCRFTCSQDVPDESCYAARPWRDYAKVKLINCDFGRHARFEEWTAHLQRCKRAAMRVSCLSIRGSRCAETISELPISSNGLRRSERPHHRRLRLRCPRYRPSTLFYRWHHPWKASMRRPYFLPYHRPAAKMPAAIRRCFLNASRPFELYRFGRL